MSTVTLPMPLVNHLALMSTGTDSSSPATSFVIAMLVVAVLLVFAVRLLRPTVVAVAEILRGAVQAAFAATLIIGALAILLIALLIH